MEDVKEIKFEIVRKLGLLSEGGRGWRKELNIVAWNEREPKLDIRDWAEDHSRMGKGVTLTRDEAGRLYEYIGIYLKS
ncbi:MAG: PC4/YdbC family ssDNA-binding protein [Rectinemataceae bacterium]|jgi:hypothetical protein